MISDQQKIFLDDYDVSRETFDRLVHYESLLHKWNPVINLVSKSSVPHIWLRHFSDSAQIYQLRPSKPCHWVDLGSGGGFPALVLSIIALELNPVDRFTLVESDVRKVAFLQTVIRELGLNASVIAQRIEKIQPLKADVLTARALTSLSQLLDYACNHLRSDGIALFLKGESYKSEITHALGLWNFEVDEITSKTNPAAAMLKIGGISRV